MRNFRKIIAGLTILVLCFGLLQGCGKTSEASASAASTSAASSSAACTPVTTVSEPATTAVSEEKIDTAVAQNESQDPSATTSNWKEVSRMKIEHATNYAGFLTDTYGITIGYAGEIHYTNDGGKTWPAAENKSACRFGLDMLNENFALNSGNAGDNRISRDGGKTWQEITNYGSSQPDQNRFVSIVDEKTFWLASTKNMARSADSGKTWQEIKMPDGMTPISAISFQTSDEGYVLNTKGTLFATKDGGKTWNEQNIDFQKLNLKGDKLSNNSAPLASLRFIDSQNAVLALYGTLRTGTGHVIILKTADGGKTWKNEILPENYPIATVFLSRDAKHLTLYTVLRQLVVLSDTE